MLSVWAFGSHGAIYIKTNIFLWSVLLPMISNNVLSSDDMIWNGHHVFTKHLGTKYSKLAGIIKDICDSKLARHWVRSWHCARSAHIDGCYFDKLPWRNKIQWHSNPSTTPFSKICSCRYHKLFWLQCFNRFPVGTRKFRDNLFNIMDVDALVPRVIRLTEIKELNNEGKCDLVHRNEKFQMPA